MRCKGDFINDRMCDVCKIADSYMYYECKAMYEDSLEKVVGESLFVDTGLWYGEIKNEEDWKDLKNVCTEDINKLSRPKKDNIEVFTFSRYTEKGEEVETIKEFLSKNEYDYKLNKYREE